jgi:hypothetical protein
MVISEMVTDGDVDVNSRHALNLLTQIVGCDTYVNRLEWCGYFLLLKY